MAASAHCLEDVALSKGWIGGGVSAQPPPPPRGGPVVRRGREWLQQRVACPCLPQASALDVYSLCTVSLCTPAGGAPRLPPARTRPMLRSSFLVFLLWRLQRSPRLLACR